LSINWITILIPLVVFFFAVQLKDDIVKIIGVRRTPTTKINALPLGGRVEIVGNAQHESMLSPFSKTPCVFWRVKVEEDISSDEDSKWITIYENVSYEPIEISDETGKIKVSVDQANLELKNYWPNERTDETKQFLNSRGFPSNCKVYEWLIKPDTQVYVLADIQEPLSVQLISENNERGLLTTLYTRVILKVAVAVFIALVLYYIAWRFL
jgi:hypothetical protein